MRRVLMVCYYFPPLGGVGSIRAAAFATLLPRFGWQPLVVTPRAGVYHADPTLRVDEPWVRRTGSLELSRLGKRLTGLPAEAAAPADIGRWRGFLRAAARRFVHWPDGQRGWAPFARAAGRAALREVRCHAVFSSSFPITAHRVARALAREHGLPWLAEFRDPWLDALPASDPARPRAAALEGALLAAADAVVAPSPSWAEALRLRGGRRATVITNGFDPQRMPAAAPPADAFVLTHLGSFYNDRQDLSALWPALVELRGRLRPRPLRLRVVGDGGAVARAAAQAGLADCLEETGFVAHGRALELAGSSSALLVAGARDERPVLRGMIPAKVFEYLATGLPILYVGSLSADVALLLRAQPACLLAAPHDAEGLRAQVAALAALAPVARDVSAFTHSHLAGQLAAVLDAVSG